MPFVSALASPMATTVSSYDDRAWTGWVTTAGTATTDSWLVWVNTVSTSRSTDTDARNQIFQRLRAQDVERHERSAKAEQAAKDLLLLCLSPEQRARYELDGNFEVKGNRSGNVYSINCHSYAGNIRRSDGRIFCAHPPADVPMSDMILAQKLAIECYEEHFLEKANVRVA
jgi:hypothetical protein